MELLKSNGRQYEQDRQGRIFEDEAIRKSERLDSFLPKNRISTTVPLPLRWYPVVATVNFNNQ